MDETIKDSQRVTKSCIECGRRKIRCDKKVPCTPCVKRHVAHECKRPITRVRGKLRVDIGEAASGSSDETIESLLKERSALRAQIAQLEVALTLTRPHVPRSPSEPTGDVSGFENLIPALEQFDLNIGKIRDSTSPYTSDHSGGFLQRHATAQSLPSRIASKCIVEWSLSTLGWIHCAVRVDEFLLAHDTFWNQIQADNTEYLVPNPWLALYFSILAAGMMYMDPAEHDITPSELPKSAMHDSTDSLAQSINIARLWYDEALQQLEKSKFWRYANLETIQTIIVLTLCNSNFGEHRQEYNFLGLAVNMARSLDLHRLGDESTVSNSIQANDQWSTIANRELGRRLWWTLVICDWLGPWTRPYSISPATFACSVSSSGPYDYLVVQASPSTTATTTAMSPTTYQTTLSRLAYTLYVYVKANPLHSSDKLGTAIDEVQNIRRDLPLHLTPFFSGLEDNAATTPAWIPFQRFLTSQVIDFVLLSLARVLVMSASPNASDTTRHRSIAIEAAMRILKNYVAVTPREYKLLWASSASAVAAGVYLVVDQGLSQQDPNIQLNAQARMDLVRRAAASMREYSAASVHAAKGSAVLEKVVAFCDDGILTEDRERSFASLLAHLTGQHGPRGDDAADLGGMVLDDMIWTNAFDQSGEAGTNQDWETFMLGDASTWDDVLYEPRGL